MSDRTKQLAGIARAVESLNEISWTVTDKDRPAFDLAYSCLRVAILIQNGVNLAEVGSARLKNDAEAKEIWTAEETLKRLAEQWNALQAQLLARIKEEGQEDQKEDLSLLHSEALAEDGLRTIARINREAEALCPGLSARETEETPRRTKPSRMTATELLKRPLSERRWALGKAAELAEKDYEEGGALRGFDAFGKEDLHDEPDPR